MSFVEALEKGLSQLRSIEEFSAEHLSRDGYYAIYYSNKYSDPNPLYKDKGHAVSYIDSDEELVMFKLACEEFHIFSREEMIKMLNIGCGNGEFENGFAIIVNEYFWRIIGEQLTNREA